MVSKETLAEAVKALNSSGLSTKQVNPDLLRYEELKEKFLEAAETVPESREEELPAIVGNTYNQIVSEEDAASEPAPKPEKKNEPKPKTKKEEGKKDWREGSSCQRFYEIMVEAGDKGISIDDAVKIAEERKIPAKDAKSRIIDVWYTATKRGIAEKKGNLYYAK